MSWTWLSADPSLTNSQFIALWNQRGKLLERELGLKQPDLHIVPADKFPATDVGLQSAIDELGIQGGEVWASRRQWTVRDTVNLASNVALKGVWGGSVEGLSDPQNGTYLKWAGGSGGTVIRVYGKQFVNMDGFCIDGNQQASTIGLLIDSENNPATRNVSVRNFSIVNCGSPNDINGAALKIGSSSADDRQNDRVLIENFHLKNAGYGLHVDSANALSMSTVSDGLIEDCNRGAYFEDRGPMTMRSVIFGSATPGTDPSYIWDAGQNPLTIQNCQGENGTGNFLTVADNINIDQPLTLIQNNFDRPSELRVGRQVVSMGNYMSQNVTLSGDSISWLSLQDSFATGKGFVVTGSGATLHQIGKTKIGFFNAAPITQPAVTGSRGGNAALASLLTELAALGLIIDSTS